MEPWAKTALIVVFLAIFVLTALITLAGMIESPPGSPLLTVDPDMHQKLFAALIAQVIGAVLVLFKTTFMGASRLKSMIFKWTMEYEPHVHRDWLKLQTRDVQEAIEHFLTQRDNKAKSTAQLLRESPYQEYILYYLGFEESASLTGTGRLVLIVNQETKNIEGISEFAMPKAPKIPLSVIKGSLSNGREQLKLTFDQPERVKSIDSMAFEYRAVPLDITFKKVPRAASYEGELKVAIGNAELRVAKTLLALETEP